MAKDSAEDFDQLLAWLAPDREAAGKQYEIIRQQLIKIFSWRHCLDPEGLADETIIRVTRKVSELRKTYVGDPRLYFFGVARNVLRESRRLSTQAPALRDQIAPEVEDSREQLYNCLDKCMDTLTAVNRQLLLTYYESKKGIRASRNALANQLGLRPSALRMRVLRITMTLEKCIEDCMKSDI